MQELNVVISAEVLAKGLRSSKRNPRDVHALLESKGAVGRNGVLAALDGLSRIDTSALAETFPFPQLFVFVNHILVCGKQKIYEYVNGALVLKYTATTFGETWEAVDFYDFLYLTNGAEAVIRNPETGVYSLSSTVPAGFALCNYNGQILVGGVL